MENSEEKELYVLIMRSHGGNKCSPININELSNVQWGDMSGGYRKRQSGNSLYGYIPYERAMELVDCSGQHNRGYNDARVLIVKQRRNDPYYEGYKALLNEAGEKPKSRISLERPDGEPPCTQKLLSLLSTGPKTRDCIRSELLAIGYQETTIRGAIYRLKTQEKIICDGPPQSKNQLISLKAT